MILSISRLQFQHYRDRAELEKELDEKRMMEWLLANVPLHKERQLSNTGHASILADDSFVFDEL